MNEETRINSNGQLVHIYRGAGQPTYSRAHFDAPDYWIERLLELGGYRAIHVNRWSAAFPGTKAFTRPDLWAERFDGRVDIFEIAHPTQTFEDLIEQAMPFWQDLNRRELAGDIVIIDSDGRTVLGYYPA
jgi:hypothetical protein